MKPIPGFEGLYSAEEDGRIYSHKRNKYLSPSRNRCGYFQVVLCDDTDRKTIEIHRLVALTFIPNPENKYAVDHIDRDKTNNSINNLRWNTRAENRINTTYNNNNILKEKHISKKHNTFVFQITRNKIVYHKCFKTLEEAKQYRDTYLSVPNRHL